MEIEYSTDYYGRKWWDVWFYDEHGNASQVVAFITKPTKRQIRKLKKLYYII